MPVRTDDPPPAAGRHTLGSSYDPPAEPDFERLPAEPPPLAESLRANVTIYVDNWHAARRRLERLDGDLRALCTALMDHVEAGWPSVRELQNLYARNHLRAHERDALGYVLSFIDSDVVDLYRGVASDASELVPLPGRSVSDVDPGDLDGEAECFSRCLAVMSMAVGDAGVPDAVRETVRRVERELEGWHAALRVLLRRIDVEVDRPALGSGDEDDVAA